MGDASPLSKKVGGRRPPRPRPTTSLKGRLCSRNSEKIRERWSGGAWMVRYGAPFRSHTVPDHVPFHAPGCLSVVDFSPSNPHIRRACRRRRKTRRAGRRRPINGKIMTSARARGRPRRDLGGKNDGATARADGGATGIDRGRVGKGRRWTV